MKIRVYQIDANKDHRNLMFRGYDDAVKTVGSIDESAYKCVYDGYIRAGALEDIYDQLNSEHPIGYNGHSLSVSDVVYIPENEECISSGCYYCDTFGFKRLETFDISKIPPITGHRMLVIEPQKVPYEMIIPDGLEPLQQAVKGYIECTYPFDDNAFVIGNEEAKLIGMEGNRTINGQIYAGPILIAADDGYGGTTDLTDEQIQKYTHEFAVPEVISDAEVANSIRYRIYGFN